MPTEVVKVYEQSDYWPCIRRAALAIRDGGMVGFPTETVYGVGVRADSPEAVARLRLAKRREETKPFTVHIGRPEQVFRFVPQLSGMARRFVRKAWPGPLTLVFPVEDPSAATVIRESGADRVPLMYHDGTVGIRNPADRAASDLLHEAGVPVVAASANRAGQVPPRTAEGVMAELSDEIDFLLDGGRTRYAKPSTVVKLNGSGYWVLRDGVIDERTLKRFGSLSILLVCSGNTCRSPMAGAICRQLLAARIGCRESELHKHAVYVFSAGVHGAGGSPASSGAVTAMAGRGLDLSGHVASCLDVETINQADHIFAMTQSHIDVVLSLVPEARDRTALLGGDIEIEDPFGGSVEVYRECAERIGTALEARLSEIEL